MRWAEGPLPPPSSPTSSRLETSSSVYLLAQSHNSLRPVVRGHLIIEVLPDLPPRKDIFILSLYGPLLFFVALTAMWNMHFPCVCLFIIYAPVMEHRIHESRILVCFVYHGFSTTYHCAWHGTTLNKYVLKKATPAVSEHGRDGDWGKWTSGMSCLLKPKPNCNTIWILRWYLKFCIQNLYILYITPKIYKKLLNLHYVSWPWEAVLGIWLCEHCINSPVWLWSLQVQEAVACPWFRTYNSIGSAEILIMLWFFHNTWQYNSPTSILCSFISSQIKTTKLWVWGRGGRI